MKAHGFSPRVPTDSALWQIISQYSQEFERTYESVYQEEFGPLRPEIPAVIKRFLECGNPQLGLTRIQCENKQCKHEHLLPFSCKCRGFCPSCQQRKVQKTAHYIVHEIIAPVPHRLITFTMPKLLRGIFRRHRHLLGNLFSIATESLRDYLRAMTGCPDGDIAAIAVLHTHGEFCNFHPHIHCMAADGLFVEGPSGIEFVKAGVHDSDSAGGQTLDLERPKAANALEKLFRENVINLLLAENVLSAEGLAQLNSWTHSGFSAHFGEVVPAIAIDQIENLAQYILRNPFSVEKIVLTKEGVIYHSELREGRTRNFETFTSLDFLAAITQHIPAKGTQTVRYYGFYSNKSRGLREKASVELSKGNPSTLKKGSLENWSSLIQHVWHVNPLLCPRCNGRMRIVSVITDRRVIEKILRHRNAWQDSPVEAPPAKELKEYAHDPNYDDPMPDYESFFD